MVAQAVVGGSLFFEPAPQAVRAITDSRVIKILKAGSRVNSVVAAAPTMRAMPQPRSGHLIHGVDHYENFPVASRLVPSRLRPAIVAIYRFARHADDIADEGDAVTDERLRSLRRLREAILSERRDVPVVRDVLAAADAHGLPREPLLALLDAFEQDLRTTRYPDRAALLDYCRRSANPVGELVLRLFGRWNETTRPASDAICSGLQLVNFLQDLAIDWRRGRLYLPLHALAGAGIDAEAVGIAVASGRSSRALSAVVAGEAEFARSLLCAGAGLPDRVPWRLGLELRAVLAGGHRILDRLAASGYDPIAARPRLRWRDAPGLLALVARPRRLPTADADRPADRIHP